MSKVIFVVVFFIVCSYAGPAQDELNLGVQGKAVEVYNPANYELVEVTVQEGDTVDSLAKMFGIQKSLISNFNSGMQLQKNKKILIPIPR